VRRAGTGLLGSGGRITWTVADGRHGRRWRSMLTEDSMLVGSLLLETRPDGSVAKLELATAAGLLTLHPEESMLHGNVARLTGLEHVALPWPERGLLLVVGTPATAAAGARMLEPHVGVGEGHTVPGVSIGIELAVEPATFRVARRAERRWVFVVAATGDTLAVDLDDDGIPSLGDGDSWPLELDHAH
jgi:hypothetical protein